jgi:hypothetical protein
VDTAWKTAIWKLEASSPTYAYFTSKLATKSSLNPKYDTKIHFWARHACAACFSGYWSDHASHCVTHPPWCW